MTYTGDIYNIVIEKYDTVNDKTIEQNELDDYLNNNIFIEDYYMILHNMDLKEDSSLVKEHYHIIIKLTKPYALTKILSMLSIELCVNLYCIQIQPCYNFSKALRYLTHKDNKEKYQYDNSLVCSKCFGTYESTINIGYNPYNPSFEDIVSIVERCNTITEVYSSLGLKYSRIYRNIIQDLWKEKFLFRKEYDK